MPGTNEEYLAFATDGNLTRGFHVGRTWRDGTQITEQEAANVEALWFYHQRQLRRRELVKKRRGPQAKAFRLLRRYLTTAQLTDLRRRGEFYVSLPSGQTYRLDARRGHTEQVVKHGRRWFVCRRFCIHEYCDDSLLMPPADLTLTHLLMLLADEKEFLERANARDAGGMLWNSQWLRQRSEARRAIAATII